MITIITKKQVLCMTSKIIRIMFNFLFVFNSTLCLSATKNNKKIVNPITPEKFKDINNIYGKWRVKGCRIIGFEQDQSDWSFHQIKIPKEKEQDACIPYVGKEMIITKELVDFDFGKCFECKVHTENPKFSLTEYYIYGKLPNKDQFHYMIKRQQEFDLEWMVFLKDEIWQQDHPEDEGYYTFMINYTVFKNSLDIINFRIYLNDYFDLYLVLEKVE